MNTLPSERAAVIGTIDPASVAAGTVTTDYADLSKFESVMFVILTGSLGASATVDASVVQATDSAGTGSKALASAKAITQLVKASNDNNQVIVNLRAEDLDMNNNFDHAALSVTVATAASILGVLVIGMNPRYAPASDNDLATVVEIV